MNGQLLGYWSDPTFVSVNENNLIMSFVCENPTNNEIIRLSVDNDEISNNEKVQYLSIF